jgi:hypothetical protein
MAETYMINEMYFMCEPKKRKSQKNIFRVLINGAPIKIKSPRIYMPFGGELYNDKIVLNFEIDPDKNNECHNFYAKLSQIDIAFREINEKNSDHEESDDKYDNNNKSALSNKIPHELINNVENKQFVSCIRNGKNGYIIRTHVKNGMVPHSRDGADMYTLTQLKHMYAHVELELYCLWTSSTSYGYIWYASDVIVS